MVDVVSTRSMSSETEVRVARNFLTKILRSSMRYPLISHVMSVEVLVVFPGGELVVVVFCVPVEYLALWFTQNRFIRVYLEFIFLLSW